MITMTPEQVSAKIDALMREATEKIGRCEMPKEGESFQLGGGMYATVANVDKMSGMLTVTVHGPPYPERVDVA